MRVVQGRGPGTDERVVSWAPNAAEEAAMMAALAALVSGELPALPPTDPGQPPPPYLSVTWITRLDGQILSGRMVAPGLRLPPPLAETVARLMPGSLCDAP